jgi:phosphoribosylformimino-5-aminoimidazole carboxamide ribotide isomerase
MFKEFGTDKIVMALDCQIDATGTPIVKTHGWQDSNGDSIWELLDFYKEAKYLLCTDISVDGTLKGPNIELYQQLKIRYPQLQLIASGGVSSLDDLKALKKIGVYATVVGKAMYEAKIDIKEALLV